MFRKIDRWIGRHMSAYRWSISWAVLMLASSIGIGLTALPWSGILMLVVMLAGVMTVLNARRDQ